MKNRLRYLARIRRMRLAKVRLSRAIIPLLIVILLSPLFTVLIPLKTNAAGTNGAEFTYIDNLSTGAKAVGIMAATTDGPQRYHRVYGGTHGSYNGGEAKGYDDDGCVAVIQTDSRRYDGSSNATWWASCTDGVRDKTPITIAPFKNIVGKWIDHSRIQVDGTVYYDGHTDDNNSYSATNQNNSCDTNIIDSFPHSGGNPGNATEYGHTKITIHKPVSSANSNCLTGEYPIAFDDHNNYAKYFSWVDAGTIQTSDGTAMTFVEGDDKGHYLDDGSGRSSDSKCKSGITADPNDPGHGVLVLRNSDGNPFPTGFSPQISGADMRDSGGCKVSQRLTVNIAGTVNAKKAPGTGNAGSGSGSGSDDGGGVACNLGIGLSVGGVLNAINPLNWLLCGLVQGLNGVVTELDDQINNILALDTDQIFGNDGYEKSWSKFKNIALGLLVVVSLIVVIAQAVGMEIVDAYTIRKMLPRILIATVAIVLSWQLMKFSVNLANDLGWGVKNLIESSFPGSSTVFDTGGAEGLLLGLAGALGVAVFGIFGLMSFAGTAAIAVIITFLVLILRQIAIIMMMVFAPIAILAYVLPNTQRVYKFWWESFSKMLLMFPMIVGFIAIGHVFSGIADGSALFINQVIAFIAYFGPYFAIPLTFRFAGSVMGTMGNAVNSRGEGARNFLTKKRQEHRAQRVQRARAGKLWREGWGSFGGRLGVDKHGRPRSISRYANRAALWGLDPDEMIPATIGARGGRAGKALFGNYAARAQDLIAQETMGHVTKAAQEAQANGSLHHKAERALAGTWGDVDSNGNGIGGGYSARLQQELRDSGFEDGHAPETSGDMQRMAQVMRTYGDTYGDRDIVSAAGDLDNMAGFMGNLNKNPEMYRAGGNVQSVGAMMLANSGRLGSREQAQVLESVRQSSPHHDTLASRLEKQTSAIGSRQRTELRHGKGAYQDAAGVYHSAFDNPSSAQAVDNVVTAKMPELMGSKGETVDQFEPTWAYLIGSGPANGYDNNGNAQWSNDQETVRQQMFQLASQYSSSDPSAKSKALDVLDRLSQQHTGPTPSLRQEFDMREQRAYNQGGAGLGGAAAGGGGQQQPPPAAPPPPPAASDRRLKRNIAYVSTTDAGLDLYSFQYLWSDQVYVGVMAQDLLETHPGAVIQAPNGFYRVDYSILGLKLLTIEEWALLEQPEQATLNTNH